MSLSGCVSPEHLAAIAIPMGMSSRNNAQRMLPIGDILSALDSAEKYFQCSIKLTEKAGDVVHLRGAAVSLALVKAFQTSLGKLDDFDAICAASLLGKACLLFTSVILIRCE